MADAALWIMVIILVVVVLLLMQLLKRVLAAATSIPPKIDAIAGVAVAANKDLEAVAPPAHHAGLRGVHQGLCARLRWLAERRPTGLLGVLVEIQVAIIILLTAVIIAELAIYLIATIIQLFKINAGLAVVLPVVGGIIVKTAPVEPGRR